MTDTFDSVLDEHLFSPNKAIAAYTHTEQAWRRMTAADAPPLRLPGGQYVIFTISHKDPNKAYTLVLDSDGNDILSGFEGDPVEAREEYEKLRRQPGTVRVIQ